MKNYKVKVGLTLVVDLLSQCCKCYFCAEGEALQGESGQDVCTVDTSCSGNLVVKDSTLPSCYLHILMLTGRRKPQKLVFLLS